MAAGLLPPPLVVDQLDTVPQDTPPLPSHHLVAASKLEGASRHTKHIPRRTVMNRIRLWFFFIQQTVII
jgi:hypothetical protein